MLNYNKVLTMGLLRFINQTMGKIERRVGARIPNDPPRRRPGERVNMFHPDYQEQVSEDRRTGFEERFSELVEDISKIEDPKVRTVLEAMLTLMGNLNEGISPVEDDFARRRGQESLESQRRFER